LSHHDYPVTAAVRILRESKIPFTPHMYDYEEHGGAPHASHALALPLHSVVKTLVMETDEHAPLLVLMHGNLEVSTKQLARHLGFKKVSPCDPATAQKHTGYLVGGISPLGTRTHLPVYVEASVLELSLLYINGGKRGFLIAITPTDLQKVLAITPVAVAIPLS